MRTRAGGRRLVMFALLAAAMGAMCTFAGTEPAHTAPAPATRNALGYRLAVPPYAFAFPRDHAAHPDFQTEWWYYTGHLEHEGRWFGFELTFFRVGLNPDQRASASSFAPHTVYLAHLALTDEAGRRFRFDQRLSRGALGAAGADSSQYRVWIGDWSATLAPDGTTHRLQAASETFSLTLDLESRKPPAIHGRQGVSQKSEGVGRASHYYSMTRLAASGTLTIDGRPLAVRGEAWMDHEFGSSQLGPGLTGWDWYSLQLADGRELMLYALRRADGSVDPYSSGTLIAPDGRTTHLPREAFSVTTTARWTSEASGAVYPAGWRIQVPAERLNLTLDPVLADQELRTAGVAGVNYWEGAVRVTGTARGSAISGRGYVELTGYAGAVPGF